MERYPETYSDYTEESIFKFTNCSEWLKTQDEYKEYFHEASEYWDDDGNFVYPGKTADDPEFHPGMRFIKYVADATMPQEVMDKLDTRKLLEIANNEKCVVSAADEGCWDVGYINVISVSAAYREFLKRDDYPQAIYEFYVSINPEEYIGKMSLGSESTDEDIHVIARYNIVSISEVTLATDKVYDALDDSQRDAVIDKKNEIEQYMNEMDYYSRGLVAWDWYYDVDGKMVLTNTAFDTVIGAGVSSKWSAYIKETYGGTV